MPDIAGDDQTIWLLRGDLPGKLYIAMTLSRAIMKIGRDDDAHTWQSYEGRIILPSANRIRSTLWRHEVSLWGYSGFGQERIRVSIRGN
jgi:hypothetical protein